MNTDADTAIPLNADAVTSFKNVDVTFTINPSTGEIDAVALPLNIFVESIAKLANVILDSLEPSPTKYEPLATDKFPLTFVSPTNKIFAVV